MAILPHTILKALRSSYAHLHAPVAAAEATLTQAERTLSSAQRASVDATKFLVKIDKTSSALIKPLRAQAQAAYDEAQATQKVAQLAVAVATTTLIDAYAVCAQYAFLSYTAAMQAADPEFRDPRADEGNAHTQTVTQQPLFTEKPDIKGKKK